MHARQPPNAAVEVFVWMPVALFNPRRGNVEERCRFDVGRNVFIVGRNAFDVGQNIFIVGRNVFVLGRNVFAFGRYVFLFGRLFSTSVDSLSTFNVPALSEE